MKNEFNCCEWYSEAIVFHGGQINWFHAICPNNLTAYLTITVHRFTCNQQSVGWTDCVHIESLSHKSHRQSCISYTFSPSTSEWRNITGINIDTEYSLMHGKGVCDNSLVLTSIIEIFLLPTERFVPNKWQFNPHKIYGCWFISRPYMS